MKDDIISLVNHYESKIQVNKHHMDYISPDGLSFHPDFKKLGSENFAMRGFIESLRQILSNHEIKEEDN